MSGYVRNGLGVILIVNERELSKVVWRVITRDESGLVKVVMKIWKWRWNIKSAGVSINNMGDYVKWKSITRLADSKYLG